MASESVPVPMESSPPAPTETSSATTKATPPLTESTPAPTDSTPTPTESAPVPSDSTPALTESVLAPSASTSALTESTPALSASTSALTESTPALSDSTSALTESVLAPSASTSALTESTPALSDSTPAATESTPAPTESAPVPPESAPAPTESASATTESAPAATESAVTSAHVPMDTSPPIPVEPWVYEPKIWDHEELHKLYKRSPVPTAVPQEITVTMQGQDGNTTSWTILATETSFRLGEQLNVRYIHVRYVSTHCDALRTDDEEDRFVIMVSIRQPKNNEIEIFNMYIKPDTAEKALDTLNFLQFHIFKYLRETTGQENPTVLQEFVRPMIVSEFELQIRWRKEKKTFNEKRILVLDQECVSLYVKPFEEQPRDQMFFWREQRDKSATKVSHIKSANCVLFQSRQMYLVISYSQDMIPQMEEVFRDIHPVPKIAFENPGIMLKFLSGDYAEPVPEQGGEAFEEWEPLDLETKESEKLNKLRRELQASLKNTDNRQFQTLWDNLRPELEQKLRSGALQEVNEKSWPFEPNNVDHLKEAIRHIENELFTNIAYETALATTLAMKRLFLASRVIRIRRLMEENPLDLLGMIFARGNVSTKKPTAAADARAREQELPEEEGLEYMNEDDIRGEGLDEYEDGMGQD